uniref:Uncharacterized protein n=1 Tax=Macrostomum lignano TaxID=282301 RepID=A0A1I8FWU5_9PLAT
MLSQRARSIRQVGQNHQTWSARESNYLAGCSCRKMVTRQRGCKSCAQTSGVCTAVPRSARRSGLS